MRSTRDAAMAQVMDYEQSTRQWAEAAATDLNNLTAALQKLVLDTQEAQYTKSMTQVSCAACPSAFAGLSRAD